MNKILQELLKKYYSIFSRRRIGFYQEVHEENFLGRNVAGEITKEDLNPLPFANENITDLIDQGPTDFCVGCGSAYGSESTEGLKMSWRGAFALFCQYVGGITSYGASVLKMLLAKVKFGIPERSYCEYDFTKSRDWNADWKNLSPEAIANAKEHKAESVWEANRPYGFDRFDCFRAWLWKFHDKKILIQTGIDGHNVTISRQAYHPKTGELCLVGPDSYGNKSINYRVGKSINGWRYWTREEANQLPTGNFTLDIPRSVAELINKYNEKAVKVAGDPACFLIRNAKRHSLVNEFVALANNCLMYEPDNVYEISKEDMDLIPLGDPVKFKDGKNWQTVQRILEKIGATEILKELANL